MIDIFINVNAQSPTASATKSAQAPIPTPFRSFVAKDKLIFRVFLVDGAGNFDTESGDNTDTVKLAIGEIAGAGVLAQVTSFTQVTVTVDGVVTTAWKMTLDTNVANVTTYVSGLRSKTASFEVQVTKTTGEVVTPLQQDVEILNKLQ